ncbi:MAG: ArnT family glycosyltransferase [Elusimicrobiota bacterium]
MGKRHRKDLERTNQGQKKNLATLEPPAPNAISKRWPTFLTIVALLALYAWIFSWSDGLLYSFYTTHVLGNFHVIGTFFNLLSTLRPDVIIKDVYDVSCTFAIFACAFALGRIIIDLFGLCPNDWGRQLKALAIGLGSLSLILLFLGLFGLWTRSVMIILLLVPLVVGFIRHAPEFLIWIKTRDIAAWNKNISIWEMLGFALLAMYLLMNLMNALGPEYFYDSLVYHLAMPKLYLLEHRIVPTPSMIYSGIPFGTEMLYGLGLAFGSGSIANLIHYGFGAAIAATIYSWSKNLANRKVAILATLLFYSVPMVCFESGRAMVELAMTFYLFVAALIILEVAGRESLELETKPLIMAGALAGFGFSTKYNAGLYIPALALPLIFKKAQIEESRWKSLAKNLSLFFGSAAIVASPWLIKNWFFYRNPVYPFLHNVFSGSLAANSAGLESDAHPRNLIATVSTWAGLKDFFLGILDLRLHGNIADNIGPGLEVGLPWLFLVRWKSTMHKRLLLLVVGIGLAWALHTTMPRFIMPAIPLFCILVAAAVCLIDLPRQLRFILIGFFGYTVTISMPAAFMVLADPGTWKVAYGRISESDYLLHEHPGYDAPYYAGVQFINQNLPQDATVLFIGEERGFYCERKFITASVFDINPLVTLADAASNSSDLANMLQREGITHLLINAGSEHYQAWLKTLSPESQSKFEGLLSRNTQLLFEDKKEYAPNDRSWVQVYKIVTANRS